MTAVIWLANFGLILPGARCGGCVQRARSFGCARRGPTDNDPHQAVRTDVSCCAERKAGRRHRVPRFVCYALSLDGKPTMLLDTTPKSPGLASSSGNFGRAMSF